MDNPTRDSAGRFAPGNPGGPGNPQCKQLVRLRQAFLEVCDVEQIRLLTQRLIELTRHENKRVAIAAISMLLDRALGKPTESLAILHENQHPHHELEDLSDAQLHEIEQILTHPAGRHQKP
jgi:hypothetical protein